MVEMAPFVPACCCQAVLEDPRNGRGRKQSDEVESLAAARNAALSGSEPSDSIRVVNALLTQLDKLKSAPNVIILTTSNITAAIGRPVIKFRCHMRRVHFSLFILIFVV
ncbi:hypothetical protein FXO37_28497, partial [Capsicum annuum]